MIIVTLIFNIIRIQEKLSSKVNKKVMGMMEKAEIENEELKRKKEVRLISLFTHLHSH